MTMIDATSATCWTPQWVQRVTKGHWLTTEPDATTKLTGICIDSRAIKPGQVFLAVKGANFDGHDYIDAAFKQNAALVIIDREEAASNIDAPGVLLVDNTIDALQQLAADYRKHLKQAGCTVIAVAGSNGKTTTRHLIHTVLASTLKGTQSPKSFNNHIGVPLTLLGASLDDDYLVAEVGTNHPGEIDSLGKILLPDAAVITCIGNEHMEYFIDLDGVAKEEAAITQYLPDGAPLFIEQNALNWVSKAPTFNKSVQVLPYKANLVSDEPPIRLRLSASATINLPLPAPHDANNATAAIEVARWMNVDDDHIKQALENATPMPGRLVIKRFGPATVIDDTYNANPDSVAAALDVLKNYAADSGARRVAILGDMLELGAISKQSHENIGKALVQLAQSGILQQATLIGPLMADAAKTIAQADTDLPAAHYPDINEQTFKAIIDSLESGDIILCKGSRGLMLERLVKMIETRFTQQP